MKRSLTRLFLAAALATFTMTGAFAASSDVGAVYVASNAPGVNEILVFDRDVEGGLTPAGSVATGGSGTGGGLGNQGGLVLTDDERFLFVVNAGSDSISAFAIGPDGPELVDTVPSGGVRPVSIAVDRRLLYVVHAGGAGGAQDSVTGFRIGPHGTLEPIAGSSQPLSADSTAPAQVGFTADGRFLLVTEKATNVISVFPVQADGTLGVGSAQPSIGATPFGFDVDRRGHIFVSEAFGGAPNASTVSAYEIDANGNLAVLDASSPTTETAACWFLIGPDGRFGYTTNTGSGTLSGFSIGRDGRLTLLDADGATAASAGGPIDLDFSRDGRSLFVLNGGANTVTAFRVDASDGSLAAAGLVGGLPVGANGLAAR
jgi:6-phosphogluconolactonase (cycloisomerase 2 family)